MRFHLNSSSFKIKKETRSKSYFSDAEGRNKKPEEYDETMMTEIRKGQRTVNREKT